ncbi:MAG TPA: hypothetical protein VH044_05050 [Polyangiaceae bacterium]|jgi:hypothetical protein|nr:hypothetical protein [Polyangiaceae bacterium]
MGDRPNPQPSGDRGDLQTLAESLRAQARQLGDADAIAAAEKLHEHAHADTPNRDHMRALLAELETKLALSSTVNALLQALTNVGM